MSKSSIQFACILFMLAAILAVSAQDSTAVLNNATMNNTTLLNNTTEIAPANGSIIAAANESTIEVAALPVEAANETALNETASNETAAAPVVAAAENDTQVALTEAVASENATQTIEAIPAIPIVQPSGISIGTSQKTTFAISGIGRTPNQFSIDGKALAQGAYEVGLPAKTIMDLSALPFFINKF